MGLVIAQNLVLSDEDDALPDGVPLILWDNLVTISNVSADTEEVDHPATELANPATNLYWLAEDTTEQHVTAELNTMVLVDGVGIAGHNLGTAGIAASIEGATAVDSFQKVLLHFDGADASTTITDSNAGGSAHTWTANASAQIDTAQSKFGGASGLFDGTGDYVSTPDHADFALGSGNFTIDCWFNCNAAGGVNRYLAGQSDASLTAATASFFIRRTAGNVMEAGVFSGGVQTTVTGTTQFTNAVNTGWHHLAFVRTGNILKLFIDGVQEGGDIAFSSTVTDSNQTLSVGTVGTQVGGNEWLGWIDEFRLSVGVARWTATFVPPSQAYDQWAWSELVAASIPANDEPLLYVFTGLSLAAIRIKLTAGTEAARIASFYAGKLLRCERGFDVGSEYTPPRFARKTETIHGVAHRGHYLGSVVTSESIAGATATFKHFNADWYRENFDPFVRAARRGRASVLRPVPFFYAGRPVDYPREVAYAWLPDDPMPMESPITGRMGVSLKMDGIVE